MDSSKEFIQSNRRVTQRITFGTPGFGSCPRFGLNLHLIQQFSFQILLGLKYCHERGVVHRDIKPSNVLLNHESASIRIADFGTARRFRRGEPRTPEVCTTWYRAPGLLLGDLQYTHKADIWSVGCIVGEMICGYPLFPGENEIDTLYHIFQMLGFPSGAERVYFSKLPFFSVGP